VGLDMIMNREENASNLISCGFSTCPPGIPVFCLQSNVLAFSDTRVLASQLPTQGASRIASAGWVTLDLARSQSAMQPASNGNIFHGLPVTGFAATKYINDFVPRPGGGFSVGNFTGAYHHRTTTVCENPGKPACL